MATENSRKFHMKPKHFSLNIRNRMTSQTNPSTFCSFLVLKSFFVASRHCLREIPESMMQRNFSLEFRRHCAQLQLNARVVSQNT